MANIFLQSRVHPTHESCDSHVTHHLDNMQPCPLSQPFNALHCDVAKPLVGLTHKLRDAYRRDADLHKLEWRLTLVPQTPMAWLSYCIYTARGSV